MLSYGRATGHKIVKCSCGTVIAQCRCPALNKPVEIVENGCNKCQVDKKK